MVCATLKLARGLKVYEAICHPKKPSPKDGKRPEPRKRLAKPAEKRPGIPQM
jgi:hypothetical protein